MRRIETNLPATGEIHILTFTDKQYENIVRFSGQRRRRQKKNPDQLALF
jgi:CRISPR-associated protein Cas2